MDKPLVSFIVPCFNKADTLSQSIQSIRDQTISNWEIILVDDNSSDYSQPIASMLKEPRMQRVFLPVNKGVVNAYREGVKRALADYVIFHDADDCSLPDRAEKCLKAIGDGDVLYHGIYLIAKHPDYPLVGRRYWKAKKWVPEKIYTEQYIPGIIFAKKSVLQKVVFPKEAEGAWDWMHHILLHQMGAKYVPFDEGLYEYWRFVGNSLSHANEMEGKRQASMKWIQEYLVKNKLVPKGHKFGKGFRGFLGNKLEKTNKGV